MDNVYMNSSTWIMNNSFVQLYVKLLAIMEIASALVFVLVTKDTLEKSVDMVSSLQLHET